MGRPGRRRGTPLYLAETIREIRRNTRTTDWIASSRIMEGFTGPCIYTTPSYRSIRISRTPVPSPLASKIRKNGEEEGQSQFLASSFSNFTKISATNPFVAPRFNPPPFPEPFEFVCRRKLFVPRWSLNLVVIAISLYLAARIIIKMRLKKERNEIQTMETWKLKSNEA